MKVSDRGKNSGFTLLEVLVALTVIGIGTALTLSLFSGSLGNIRKVQARTQSIHHAETVMELALLDDSIKGPTFLEGDFEDGTRWAVQVDEFFLPDPPWLGPQQQVMMPLALLAFTVEVMGPDSQTPDFRLQTLKLVNTQEMLAPTRAIPGGIR
jgi:prepilin-type N-terminal cleavage/methylation domain-containing protein